MKARCSINPPFPPPPPPLYNSSHTWQTAYTSRGKLYTVRDTLYWSFKGLFHASHNNERIKQGALTKELASQLVLYVILENKKPNTRSCIKIRQVKNERTTKIFLKQNFLFWKHYVLQRLKRLKTPYKQGNNIYSDSINITSIALEAKKFEIFLYFKMVLIMNILETTSIFGSESSCKPYSN